MSTETVLRAEKVSKQYPGTLALDNVDFDLKRGKVNVLIGENGAGKSTLMKLIAGIEQPTGGKIFLEDNEINLANPSEARKLGIGIIHQELNLFPNLKVYQNIFIGNEITKSGKLDNKTHIEATKKILNQLEYPISPEANLGDLRVGEQQIVEIARNLLQENLSILIMDEPTSSLSEGEVDVLFRLVRDLTKKGISIVYISHRLEEIMQIGDHVTVLRDGKLVANADVKDIDIPWIVEQMVGEKKSYPKRDRQVDWSAQQKVLEVENLTLMGRTGNNVVDDVTFDLKKGEVLGIYGLMGAGRTEVIECLMGMHPAHKGTVKLDGENISIKNLSGQISRGFAWVPESRQHEGIIATMNIERNITLASLKEYVKGLKLSKLSLDKASDKMINDVHIKVSDKTLPILSLSGGNQQKVVIAKGILTNPKVLFMDEPSRGIDIGAKTEVFEIINQYAQDGLSIIVVSSELEEIEAIADRIVVLSNGKKTAELSGDEITKDALVLASYKGHHNKKSKEGA